MATSTILLPGEQIPAEHLPQSRKGTLTLGPGLRHIPPATIIATAAGELQIDQRKAALWIEHDNGRYQPSVGDLVIAQVHHGGGEQFHCSITPYTPFALLGHLDFEGATKKTRPQLKPGDLVYGRISRASKWEDTEMQCVNPASGKAEGMGPLKNGMLFNVTPAFTRRLMMGVDKDGQNKGGLVVLEELGEKLRFEVAVGRNGKVWVDGTNVKETLMIGRLLIRADEQRWDLTTQRKMVKKALQDI